MYRKFCIRKLWNRKFSTENLFLMLKSCIYTQLSLPPSPSTVMDLEDAYYTNTLLQTFLGRGSEFCKEKTRFRLYLAPGEGRGLKILVVGFFHHVQQYPVFKSGISKEMFRRRPNPLRRAEGCNRLRAGGNLLLRVSRSSIPNFNSASSSAQFTYIWVEIAL